MFWLCVGHDSHMIWASSRHIRHAFFEIFKIFFLTHFDKMKDAKIQILENHEKSNKLSDLLNRGVHGWGYPPLKRMDRTTLANLGKPWQTHVDTIAMGGVTPPTTQC